MARLFQLDPVVGALIDPADQLLVDRVGGGLGRRASQAQIINSLLTQAIDAGVTFPPGSYGAKLISGGGGGGAAGGIDSFASTPGPVVETGATVTNPVLNWVISGVTVLSQSLSGPFAVALTASARQANLVGSLTSDATWGLTVAGSGGTLTRNASLLFGHRVHFGRATSATPNAAAILAFAGDQLATTAVGTYALPANAGSTPYWWICYPDSWGLYAMTDLATGLPVATQDGGTVSVTNASGHTRLYRCIRSLNALNAAMNLKVS